MDKGNLNGDEAKLKDLRQNFCGHQQSPSLQLTIELRLNEMGTSEDDLRIKILDSLNQQSLKNLIVDHITNNQQYWSDDERSQRTFDLYYRQMELIRYDESNDKEVVDWKRVRSSIEHENTLVNYRLTWLLASQAALFTGFAAIYQHYNKLEGTILMLEKTVLMLTVSIIGIVSCYDIYSVIRDAQKQLILLDQWWEKTYKLNRNNEYRKRHPSIQYPLGQKERMRKGNIPLLFGIVWLILFSAISIEALMHLTQQDSSCLPLLRIVGLSINNQHGWVLLFTSGLVLISVTLLRPGLIQGFKVLRRITRKRYLGGQRKQALAELNPVFNPMPKEIPATHTK